ncbi:MAG: methylmalonyl-CoA mutase family protein [Bacteroidia bacterium]
MEKLFSEFNAATAQDWKNQIIKDLKGTDFEKLIWKNPNGFDVNPFYTAEDIKQNTPNLFTHSNWEIASEFVVKDEKQSNADALKALMGGASSLIFIITKKTDLTLLLQDISIEHIELNFVLNHNDPNFIADFKLHLKQRNIYHEKINGSICFDAINHFAETENEISLDFKADNSSLKTIGVNAALYQNAGATQTFELACALTHAHEYVVALSNKNIAYKNPFYFTVAIGGDFFGEIAKLRALRKLWILLAQEYNINQEIHIHCKTSLLNKSSLDANNNMLRTTTEGMSAVIGGCNSLTVNSYNAGFETSSDFSERMARNQQLILKEESYLHQTADMGAGSYYIEKLTDELASKAWDEFKEIENKGGFMACLKLNFIQDKIKEQADNLIQQFQSGELVLVGVNKFENKSELIGQNLKAAVISSEVEKSIKPIRLSDYLVQQNA